LPKIPMVDDQQIFDDGRFAKNFGV
jgi:hypothetical protein